jgi:hypothetical protein
LDRRVFGGAGPAIVGLTGLSGQDRDVAGQARQGREAPARGGAPDADPCRLQAAPCRVGTQEPDGGADIVRLGGEQRLIRDPVLDAGRRRGRGDPGRQVGEARQRRGPRGRERTVVEGGASAMGAKLRPGRR